MAFWEEKKLAEMTEQEWESLCDGCARCCMIKLEDERSGEVQHTSLVCHLLDIGTCRCTRYPERHELVRDCMDFTADMVPALGWLPVTCAYRRLAEGLPLPSWHPLLTGSADTVVEAGISVRDKVIPVQLVHEEEHHLHIIHWIGT